MTRASLEFAELGAVAATSGPGLIGGLIVGSGFAKGLAIAHGLPFIAVNHLEAHALTARLPELAGEKAAFPYLLLLVSGGHSLCAGVAGLGHYERFGGTVDDAVGEAFDKVAKMLGLGWPGGPALEALAADGDPIRYRFPRPMLRRPGCELSLSGLKTAVAHAIQPRGLAALSGQGRADIAASFQQAVVEVLADRVANACGMMRVRHPTASLLVVAGGVAANQALRAALKRTAEAQGFSLLAPPARLCSDNAVMIAWAGLERLRAGEHDALGFRPVPRWPLEAVQAPAG